MEENLTQSNILVFGSTCVGKSTLIKSIFQGNLSKSNENLNRLTQNFERYSCKYSIGNLSHETIFWNAHGIESWDEKYFRLSVNSLISQNPPLCLIYCASPCSFASLEHLIWIVNLCRERNIFCALVCTNMWAGSNRNVIIEEFSRVLNSVNPNIRSNEEDEIIYYNNFALVTMVNSIEYIDHDLSIKPPSGIDQLIFGICKCLQMDLMHLWLKTVYHNKSFWINMSSKLNKLIQIPHEKLNDFDQYQNIILEYLLTEMNNDNQQYDSSNEDSTFDDELEEYHLNNTENFEIPRNSSQNQLKFTLRSKRMAQQLSETLARFDPTNMKLIKPGDNDQENIVVTVKFDNAEQAAAIYDLCQIISHAEATCTVVD